MPLYMDCHHTPGITLEEAEKAHLKDLAVQEYFNVKYLQYWVNEASGEAFCLMEAPDKESIIKTHRLANGIETCNIVEVDGGMYSAFMGKDLKLKDDLVVDDYGIADGGYRFILTLDIISPAFIPNEIDFNELKLPVNTVRIVENLLRKYQGNYLNQLSVDQIIAAFKTPESCLQCAIAIREELLKNNPNNQINGGKIKFKIGLSLGQPVTVRSKKMFDHVLDESMRYCIVADDFEIVVPEEYKRISVFCEQDIQKYQITTLGKADRAFLNLLFKVIEDNISESDFNVAELSYKINLSRSQLYRKVKHITKTSTVKFLRNLKLRKGLSLIKKTNLTISEIAYEIGFSNPSYFSKCFIEQFGVKPSEINVGR